ncbi:MAG: mannose-6-phosphate isomerase, class I [Spirochaetes bacterium]|nr:mannose-6-phosphate isomerase, class I [Spirochaetota bacterium]
MLKIVPRVQDYPWGSTQWIPEFLGIPMTEGKPWAELWYGAHPKAPSLVEGKNIDLLQWITKDPEHLLGARVVKTYGPELPFLLKLLAASKPLSIQCHPSRMQAREGFQRENQLGIPLDSPIRNYKDPNHKPELLLALSPVTALCGFRSPTIILQQFQRLAVAIPSLTDFFPLLEEGNLEGFYRSFLSLSKGVVSTWIRWYQTFLSQSSERFLPEDRWFSRLADQYPEDPGCFAPYYLNLIELTLGEALFLDAGVLHAYLQGFGIELMANSDNVLRGGLTSKHVDLEELLKVVRFKEEIPWVILPERKRILTEKGEYWEEMYTVPVSEFSLSILRFHGVQEGIPVLACGPEILLCGEGEWEVSKEPGSDPVVLKRGEACFIDASVPRFFLHQKNHGKGWLSRARVGKDE